MNEMLLLLGLLAFAYIGNALIAPGQARTPGLPSGAQFMGLGFLLGPHALGVVPSDAAESFRPLAIAATSWLALVLGTAYGYAGDRRVSARAFFLGFAFSAISAAAIGVCVYATAKWLTHMPESDCRLLALAIGLAGCETSRQSVRWAVERGAKPGRLLHLLEELADTYEVVPLVGLSFLFAMAPEPTAAPTLSFWGWIGLPVLLGIVLGSTSALLLSNFTQAKDTWGALLGAALLGTGVAWRLGLSPVTGLFVMGVCLSLASRHASQLRLLLCSSEPGVLLPMLLLAGALLRLPSQSGPLWVVAAAVGGRLITRWALGFVTASVARSGLQLSNRFGLALCCTGTINALLALSFALRFPGTVGDMVLATAAIGGITGDLVGAIGLRQALVTSEPEAVVNAT
ncbi:MAG TPA: hypothetical protein VFN67_29830 [Polyangiales bacterium]|nr:hypothetical protein [Polyangiales bacterium]